MKRMPLVLIVLLGLTRAVLAQDKTLDDLPLQDKVMWDVKTLEGDKESFTAVKRTVDNDANKITWLLEVNSDKAANRLNDHNRPYVNNGQYFALCYDADGVIINKTALITNPQEEMKKGDRVRATLKLPDEKVTSKTVKIVVKHMQ
jgi:copper(I)-binding protein